MIKTFRSKGLKTFWETGIGHQLGASAPRINRMLDMLNKATRPEDMNIPGYYFHKLNGLPERFSVRVTANYRITFEWDNLDAYRVDLEDYH